MDKLGKWATDDSRQKNHEHASPSLKVGAKATENIIRMGGWPSAAPMVIMFFLALALDFTLDSKIYPSV